MQAPIQYDVLTYAMYPAASPRLITTTATYLDSHHRAALTSGTTPRLRRVVAGAFTVLNGPAN